MDGVKEGPTNAKQMDRLDDGTATKEDRIYAVNVFHDEKVMQVQIEYQSLGMTYRETVDIE
ncbi:hypothetical protein [Rossellomorea vietnamensis]|uniref:Uncharacterized protein n=1 Tax=Rossellomorea vietnamensis TaxID=218284 RepID=A0A6I6UPU6_9BACI|nr:hypothetical protein [Rossellomorea vietnamensis]QHE60296.1 hypothetical protein FHE72_04015 [Rossellomorea vietnamensis]